MKRHAYLIVSNNNFSVLEVCLKLIDDERNDVYLLFDKKSKVSGQYKEQLKQIMEKSKLFILPDKVVNWAGYSQIDATVTLLKSAIQSGEGYEYLHYFQGSDLPIKTQDEIHQYFDEHEGAEFVEIWKNVVDMQKSKAQYRHFFCHNRYFRKNKLIKYINFGFVYLQKLLKIKKNKDVTLYQGSALFSITKEAGSWLIEKEKEIKRRFRYGLACDEVFIQTMLVKSPFRDKIKDFNDESKKASSNARLIDRSRPEAKNSPHVWKESEIDLIMNSNNMFARKFDEKIDGEITKKIYERLVAKKKEKEGTRQ